MKISGFTFLRNANKLYYPIRESIESILPLVDEFVVALGQGDQDDKSIELLNEINSDKIKIIHTVWDVNKFTNGSIYAQQTDVAKKACTGDWLFYLQGDEVIHENDLEAIKSACGRYLDDRKVEGFVFNYLHFFGDYSHYFSDHCWYKKEIRIIRNIPEIHSWRDAQSFRYIADFENEDFFVKKNTRKLNCVGINARVFHYGWVRPPEFMQLKNKEAEKYYSKKQSLEDSNFDYGRLDFCKVFKDSHPILMKDQIDKIYWQNDLRLSGPVCINRSKMKHEKFKYRLLIFLEEKLLNGFVLGGFKNYRLLN